MAVVATTSHGQRDEGRFVNTVPNTYPLECVCCGLGRLPVLEQLPLRDVQWSWEAISHVLQYGAEVNHLGVQKPHSLLSSRFLSSTMATQKALHV